MTIRCLQRATLLSLLIASTALTLAADPAALVRVTFTIESSKSPTEQTLDGRVLVKAADGGVLVEGRDGRLWTIKPDQLKSLTEQPEPFQLMTADELGASIQAELRAADLPGEFDVFKTEHYVLVSNSGRPYAEWNGRIFERLLQTFRDYWKSQGVELTALDRPLAAIVLANQQQFASFAKTDGSPLSAAGVGYYSITANRIVLFDFTTLKSQVSAKTQAEVIKRVSTVPGSVATVVHEATHQIAFNTGLHRRYADNPVWLTEGMAMFFESADYSSKDAGKNVGRVNSSRLLRFRDYLRKRPPDSLLTLVRDNARFGQAETAPDAYPEAWALTYYLMKSRPKEFAAYLRLIADKPQLQWDAPESRLADFRTAFGDGDDVERLMLKSLTRLNAK